MGQFLGGDADGLACIEFFTTVCPSFHCNGGEGDGNASLHESNSVSPVFYCSGGDADGNAILYTLESVSGTIYLTGGNGDGLALIESFSTISEPIYCSGGTDDGSARVGTLGNVNGPAIYCFGGNHDGAGRTSVNGTISMPIYCLGGNYDGSARAIAPAFFLGQGLWKGYVSTNWNFAANWTNSAIPAENLQIVIPAGCLNYPVINSGFSINDLNWGDTHCSRLTIDSGASFTTLDNIRINGELSISGQFHHRDPAAGSFIITNQGSVTIDPGGFLSVQP